MFNPRGYWRLLLLATLGSLLIPQAQALAFKYQGFNTISFNKFDYANDLLLERTLDFIAGEGSNLVVIDWTVAVDDDGHVLPQSDPSSFEPPRTDITHLVALASQRGLKVFLKPHIGFPGTPFDNRGTWNTNMGRFSMSVFFLEWTQYLHALGIVADQLNVDALVIGTENIGFDSANRSEWLALIADLRTVFRGKIAYNAHFLVQDGSRVTNVSFWDAVDIIALSLYVALSKNDQASLSELNAAWHTNPYGNFGDIVEFLRSLSATYGKPVMALEGGYQSIVGGLYDVGPVEVGRTPDYQVQARGFESYLDTLGKYQGDWFWGLSIWAAYPPHFDPVNQTQGYAQGYMPNGKPAANVIRDYFTGTRTYSDPVFTGTAGPDDLSGSYASDHISGGAGDDRLWGGAGDDVLVAGPTVLPPPLSTAAVVISATGDIRTTGGPKLRLVVNGSPIGGWIEVTSPHNSTPQSIAITVPLSPPGRVDTFVIETMPDPEFGNGVNRTVAVLGIQVNGNALREVDGTYAAGSVVIRGAGSWRPLYSGTTLAQDVTGVQSYFFGPKSDNDIIVGGVGNDTIDGGFGVDVAVYLGAYDRYTITNTGNTYTVKDNFGTDGTDTLTNVEILQFADRVIDLRAAPSTPTDVVEFYNASLDHYFITYAADEIAKLDDGTFKGWVRTGLSFKAFATALGGTSAVCRIYIPPGKGDGHFFGRDANECGGTMAKNPTFILESSTFFYLYPPTLGSCATGQAPVYRVFSNRADANHRYTTSRAVRDQLVNKGWIAEGDGPDIVVMCAPQ